MKLIINFVRYVLLNTIIIMKKNILTDKQQHRHFGYTFLSLSLGNGPTFRKIGSGVDH